MNWMKMTDWIAMLLSFIGGVAWGILGVFNFNVVEYIFAWDWLAKTVYILVGLSALYLGFKAIKK